jgi:hypothetical protein
MQAGQSRPTRPIDPHFQALILTQTEEPKAKAPRALHTRTLRQGELAVAQRDQIPSRRTHRWALGALVQWRGCDCSGALGLRHDAHLTSHFVTVGHVLLVGKVLCFVFCVFSPHNLLHTPADKLSPAARTGQAQSLGQDLWRVTGKPTPPLPAKTAGKGVPEKIPLSQRREGKRVGDSSPPHPSPCLGFFPRGQSATETCGRANTSGGEACRARRRGEEEEAPRPVQPDFLPRKPEAKPGRNE